MLLIVEERVKKAGFGGMSFISSDVANLPFPNEYFESVDTTFAFRNMTHRAPMAERNVSEVIRLLIAGGRFIILETSQQKIAWLSFLSSLYLFFCFNDRSFNFG